MPDYIPTKVLLHDPDSVTNPKSLYPITGLNAINAGTSGTAATTSITTSGNQIKCEYLEIVDPVTSKVYTVNLPITFVEGTGKISSASLDIFSGDGKIKADLLPGFVEDVVSIAVLRTGHPPVGNVMIRVSDGPDGLPIYTFMCRQPDNSWDLGGGESGKIYVASDISTSDVGAMFRCVEGSATEAVCISSDPYGISGATTNGVYLNKTDNILTARADSATKTRLGTVQIDDTETYGVKLAINAGTVSVLGSTASHDHVGAVLAVGTYDIAAQRINQFGGTYVVPTVQFMYDYISSSITGVRLATTSAAGIVQIGNNINVNSDGIISVNDASSLKAGVVYLEGVIGHTAEENSEINSHAVTVSGVTTYVGDVLAGYQKFLAYGGGLNISRAAGAVTSDTISLMTAGALIVSDGYLRTVDATTAEPGVLVYTGDLNVVSSGIDLTSGTSHPIAVTPKGVKDYVSAQIASSAGVPIAADNTRGGFRTSAANTGLTMGSAGGVADILKINTAAPLYIDPTSNKLSINSATFGQSGAVNVVSTSAQVSNTDYSTYIPNNAAIVSYVAGEIASGAVVKNSAGYVDGSGTDSSGTTAVPLGGVRVVSDGGIAVLSGNIYLQSATDQILGGVKVSIDSGLEQNSTTGQLGLQSATAEHLGGIKLAATSTGLIMGAGGVLSANLSEPLYHNNSSIAIRTAGADTTSNGVVNVVSTSAAITAASANINTVPNAAGLIDYITSNNSAIAGSGLAWDNGTLNIHTTSPIYLSDDAVNISSAVANTADTLPATAFGAVFVRDDIRSSATINSDARKANTVPTENAVRTLTDTTSSAIMSKIDARLYITYTPV